MRKIVAVWRRLSQIVANLKLAASLGLEPRQTDPESVVLPLHYEAIVVVRRRVERGEKGVKPKPVAEPAS